MVNDSNAQVSITITSVKKLLPLPFHPIKPKTIFVWNDEECQCRNAKQADNETTTVYIAWIPRNF